MRTLALLLVVACQAVSEAPADSAVKDSFGDKVPADATLPPPTSITLTGPQFAAAGQPVRLQASGALSGERVHLAVGSDPGDGPCYRFLGGHCFDLVEPVTKLDTQVIGPAGAASFDVVAPPYGEGYHCYQAVILRGPSGIDTAFSGVVCVDFCPNVDSDEDGVCDLFDTCPGFDEVGDADADGVCDPLDTCPGGPDGADADGDGVCDLLDTCPGGPDGLDGDSDGVCDALDACPGFPDSLDTDGDGIPNGCDVARRCSEVASDWCRAKGWVVVGGASGGNIVCTIDGRGTGSNCDTCSTYNIVVWQNGSQERHCPGGYSTVAGSVYSAHTPCACGDNLDFCTSWDMQGCTPD